VADLATALERAASEGGEVLDAPFADGPSRTLATVRDQAGNRIGLVEHRPG
jgi:predicted enzyme related to lactoylglutathione lyase